MKLFKKFKKLVFQRKHRILHRKNGSSIQFKKLLVIVMLSIFCIFLSMPVGMSPATVPIVTTDAATGVEEVNATLRGTLTDGGAGQGNVTDYFSSAPSPRWNANPALYLLMVDGSLSTFSYQQGSSNTIQRIRHIFMEDDDNTNYGNITEICVRGYGYYSNAGVNHDINFVPNIWNGTMYYGTNHTWTLTTSPAWSNWFDITNDTNMPGWDNWTWEDINDAQVGSDYGLQFNVTANTSSNVISYCAMVQLRINTTNSSTWFQYGTDTTYGTNTTAQVNETGDTFSSDVTSLTPGTLYHFRSVARNTNTTSFGSDTTFLTKPLNPTSLTTSTYDNVSISVTFTKGTGANNTILRRKTGSYPTDYTDGTLVYNDTGTSASDTSLNPGTIYYYRAWSYANNSDLIQHSDTYAQLMQNTSPSVPTNVANNVIANGTLMDINITWTLGVGSNATVIRRNTGSPPSTPQSGTEAYNGSLSYFNDTGLDQPYYYRIWAYNTTINEFSNTYTDVTWYVAWVECFDENTSLPISPYGVFITNQTGTETYEDDYCSNPHVINMTNLPLDDDVAIQVNASWYETRTYYFDIELTGNEIFYLTCYLNPTNISTLYLLQVLDEIDQPVADARMEIRRYINATVGYQNITILITDGYGQANAFLSSGELYKVNISKSGYQTEIADYIPSNSILTHTFRLESEEIEPKPPETPVEEITFNGYINSSDYLILNYTDRMDQTLDTNIVVYEINLSTGVESLFTTFSDTTNNDIQVNVSVNTSNSYRVVLYYNHTEFGYQKQTLFFKGIYAPLTTPTDVDALFEANYGINPFGWSNFILWIFLIVACIDADNRDAGLRMILIGGLFLFINSFIGFNTTTAIFAGGIIPVLFIVVGIIMMWNDSRKKTIGD